MCTTPILGTDTKDILNYESFTKILGRDKDKKMYLSLDTENVYIEKTEPHDSTSREKNSTTIYLGIERLDFDEEYKLEKHPIMRKHFPDIFFFVHDWEYVDTLKSLYLICCSNDQIDPLIIMPYSTYSLINKYSSFIYFILLHLYLLLFIHTYTYILY
jgi:hypothetical protein